ncbi:hypothetical protein KC19_2G130100 [Ceratodon purpureus]|uniref:Uncharacterized protein n=1 Tax=Ceratodon purpureus TaxID=3225 RepID=A0A8T0IW88_CERPU|nr:hypothetical protein KC19_2G130100 [Ceratodon purpureus]
MKYDHRHAPSGSHSHEFLRFPHDPPHLLLELLPRLPPLLRGIHIRRRLVVRVRQHRDDAQQDRLHRVHRRPPLARQLVPVRVVPGGVQDRDAHAPVRVHIRVPHLRREPHRRRAVGVIRRKAHDGVEETPLVQRLRRPDNGHVPLEHAAVVHQPRAEPVHGIPRQILQLLAQQQTRLVVPHGRRPDAHAPTLGKPSALLPLADPLPPLGSPNCGAEWNPQQQQQPLRDSAREPCEGEMACGSTRCGFGCGSAWEGEGEGDGCRVT